MNEIHTMDYIHKERLKKPPKRLKKIHKIWNILVDHSITRTTREMQIQL